MLSRPVAHITSDLPFPATFNQHGLTRRHLAAPATVRSCLMAFWVITLYLLYNTWTRSVAAVTPVIPLFRTGPTWPGWNGIQHMFVFGDSYSSTTFDVMGPQPSPANPLGNPKFPGFTSSNGPNWIDFLTLAYNSSYLETYNFAFGGATVDTALVLPYLPNVLSMKQQIQDEFYPIYSQHPPSVPWASEDSLFTFFIGINDVGNSYARRNKTLHGAIFDIYSGLVDRLYHTGARNFLFMNVPPVDRAPMTTSRGRSAAKLEKSAIGEWNGRVALLASNLTSFYPDSTVFLFDTHQLFSNVLDDANSYEQTSVYENTTDFCESYAAGTPRWRTFYGSCGISVNSYLWLNSLHPTFPVHNATADMVSRMLKGAS